MNSLLNIFLDENNNADISTEDLKRRRVRLIVKNQEVYIMSMKLPRVHRDLTRKFIYQELCARFKNTDNIMFDYIITEKHKKSFVAAVYCFNWNGEKIIKQIASLGGILKGVLPLQFYVLEKFNRQINSEACGVAFINGKSFYTIEIARGIAAANHVYKDLASDISVKFSCNVNQVFHINLEDSILNNYLGSEYKYINLGESI